MGGLWEKLARADAKYPPAQGALPPQARIANPKTLKTGSSTLASILFRFGARNALRMFRPGKHVRTGLPTGTIEAFSKKEHAGMADLEFHHLSAMGRWQGDYDKADAWYRHLIGRDVSVFREPVQQFLSQTFYYVVPQYPKRAPLEVLRAYVLSKGYANPLCADFGIYMPNEARAFLAQLEKRFDLILISERFDEGLVLMKHLFRWKMQDITYLPPPRQWRCVSACCCVALVACCCCWLFAQCSSLLLNLPLPGNGGMARCSSRRPR